MLTREVEKWTNTSSFGQWMCSMNGDRFVVLTQRNSLLICLKMKVQSRTLRICCHLLFCMLKKKLATYIFQLSRIFYHSLKVFVIGIFFHHVFSFFLFCLCFYKLCVFFLCVRFKVYVTVLGLGFIWRFEVLEFRVRFQVVVY